MTVEHFHFSINEVPLLSPTICAFLAMLHHVETDFSEANKLENFQPENLGEDTEHFTEEDWEVYQDPRGLTGIELLSFEEVFKNESQGVLQWKAKIKIWWTSERIESGNNLATYLISRPLESDRDFRNYGVKFENS